MSKKIFLLIYVAAVLIFSSMVARASTSQPLSVEKVQIKQDQGILTLSGHTPTPCEIKPSISVVRIDNQLKAIYLDVVATRVAEVCNDNLGPAFQIAYDLKNLDLIPELEYLLIIDGSSASSQRLAYVPKRRDGSSIAPRFEQRTVVGLMTESKSKDGSLELQKNDATLKVFSPTMNLKSFVNQNVWIKGYVVDMPNLDPMSGSEKTNTAVVPVLVSAILN